MCAANFTLCLIYDKQAVTICENTFETLVMFRECKYSVTYCRWSGTTSVLPKVFYKKKPKLEMEEVTCDESFEICQMMNMAYQMLQYLIFLFVLYTVLFVFCNSNMYFLIYIGILQIFKSKLWFIYMYRIVSICIEYVLHLCYIFL